MRLINDTRVIKKSFGVYSAPNISRIKGNGWTNYIMINAAGVVNYEPGDPQERD